jgi:UPF0755 protein
MFRRRYNMGNRQRGWAHKFAVITAAFLLLILLAMVGVRQFYHANLSAVSDSTITHEVVIEEGMLTAEISEVLIGKGLIRNQNVFQWYVKAKNAGEKILAGTYRLQPSMSTPEIVQAITRGQIATDLVTIYPGQRIDQIRQNFINSGFNEKDVDKALSPSTYANHPALVDRPAGASLEGFLYPESFRRNKLTTPEEIIKQSLDEMSLHLTPQLRKKYAERGLSVYEAITLASVVEQEASNDEDRRKIAQVFLKRISMNMALESDPTAKYGAVLDNQAESIRYSSPYNTYENPGLPPTPISNVTASSLNAVANPANSDWLFFVAGDDGTTHFSKTLEEHERLTDKYCSTLCQN